MVKVNTVVVSMALLLSACGSGGENTTAVDPLAQASIPNSQAEKNCSKDQNDKKDKCPAPTVSISGPLRAVTDTIYTYQATVTNGIASAFNWLWGDESANTAGNPANKVWNYAGNFNSSVTATVSGSALTAVQNVAVVGNPISTGTYHSCAITVDNNVSCWGANFFGQLGNNAIGDYSSVPVLMTPARLSGVVATSVGYNHSCALKNDGTVACWGLNNNGQLGDGTTFNHSSPSAVSALAGVAAISAGASHTCALKAEGSVVCWGYNASGQLGDGTLIDKSTPVPVSGLTDAVAVSLGGYHSCALRSGGSVVCWGENSFGGGQLGDGTLVSKSTPVAVLGLSDAVSVSAGGLEHTCALKADGSVVCWGPNQLSNGGFQNELSPALITGLPKVIAINAGYNNNCALKADGGVVCWGPDNQYGGLGSGTTLFTSNPVLVNNLTGVVAVRVGAVNTCALKNDGSIECWGNNANGELGDGTQAARLTPASVLGGAMFWH